MFKGIARFLVATAAGAGLGAGAALARRHLVGGGVAHMEPSAGATWEPQAQHVPEPPPVFPAAPVASSPDPPASSPPAAAPAASPTDVADLGAARARLRERAAALRAEMEG